MPNLNEVIDLRRSVKRLSCFLLVLSLVFLSTACTSSPDNKSNIRLVEVTHSIFYAPQYVALSQGFFEQEGLSVELVNGNGGDKTMTTLLAGESDIVLVGVEAGIYVTARFPFRYGQSLCTTHPNRRIVFGIPQTRPAI